MALPFDTRSILKQKAAARQVDLQRADVEARLPVYFETLNEMEAFLDTGDLTELNEASLSVLLEDIMTILHGLRSTEFLPSQFSQIIEGLRQARDELRTANVLSMKRPTASAKYFDALRRCRFDLSNALSLWPRSPGLAKISPMLAPPHSALAGDDTTDAPPPSNRKKKPTEDGK